MVDIKQYFANQFGLHSLHRLPWNGVKMWSLSVLRPERERANVKTASFCMDSPRPSWLTMSEFTDKVAILTQSGSSPQPCPQRENVRNAWMTRFAWLHLDHPPPPSWWTEYEENFMAFCFKNRILQNRFQENEGDPFCVRSSHMRWYCYGYNGWLSHSHTELSWCYFPGRANWSYVNRNHAPNHTRTHTHTRAWHHLCLKTETCARARGETALLHHPEFRAGPASNRILHRPQPPEAS